MFTTSAGEAGYLTDDPDDPSRRLIRQVLGAVSEYERSMIALRLRAGRRRKAEKGGYAYGSPPLGWRAERGELVVDDVEAEALARMAELRDDGASLREIATVLTEEGHGPSGALGGTLRRLQGHSFQLPHPWDCPRSIEATYSPTVGSRSRDKKDVRRGLRRNRWPTADQRRTPGLLAAASVRSGVPHRFPLQEEYDAVLTYEREMRERAAQVYTGYFVWWDPR